MREKPKATRPAPKIAAEMGTILRQALDRRAQGEQHRADRARRRRPPP